MNLSITQINNGWLLTLSGPQGQSCQHYNTWAEVLAEVNKMPIKDRPTGPAGPTRKG